MAFPVAPAVMLACGCSWLGWGPAATSDDQASRKLESRAADTSVPGGAQPRQVDTIVVQLLFDVERFVMSTAALADHREDLWKHVDELRLDPASIAHANRNGLRIGVLTESTLASFRKVLEGMDVRTERMAHNVQDGAPLTMDMGPAAENSSVFLFHRNGTMDGRTFSSAIRLIHVDYETTISDEPRITLRATPELFQESDRPVWRVRDGNVGYHKEYQGCVYHECAIDIDLRQGDAMVIGAAQPEAPQASLGRAILSEIIAGDRWETILCIAPRVFRNESAATSSP